MESAAVVEGTHTVLVVRILDAQQQPEDAETTARITETLGKVLFHGINDPLYPSVRDQFYQCSGGVFLLEPTRNYEGVMTVSVSVDSISDKDAWREAAAQQVLEQILGTTTNMDSSSSSSLPALVQLRSVADHVALILPQVYIENYDPEFRATGEVSSSLSTFSSDWAVSLSAYLHEWGHNLGLHHASVPSDPYGDTTSMMGISMYESYLPRKCYNAAQHWALGWYPYQRVTVTMADLQERARTMVLAGFVNHATTQNAAVLVELPNQVYLQYNLAQSYNSGVDMYPNQVVIVVQNSDGTTTLTGALADSAATHQYQVTTSATDGSTVTITIGVCSWENDLVELIIAKGEEEENVLVDCQNAAAVPSSGSGTAQSATTEAATSPPVSIDSGNIPTTTTAPAPTPAIRTTRSPSLAPIPTTTLVATVPATPTTLSPLEPPTTPAPASASSNHDGQGGWIASPVVPHRQTLHPSLPPQSMDTTTATTTTGSTAILFSQLSTRDNILVGVGAAVVVMVLVLTVFVETRRRRRRCGLNFLSLEEEDDDDNDDLDQEHLCRYPDDDEHNDNDEHSLHIVYPNEDEDAEAPSSQRHHQRRSFRFWRWWYPTRKVTTTTIQDDSSDSSWLSARETIEVMLGFPPPQQNRRK